MKKGNEICLYHLNNIYMIKRKLVLALAEAWVRRVIKFFSFGTEQEPTNMSTKRKICLSAAKKMKKNAGIGKTDPTLFGASRTVTMKPRLVHHSLGPGYRYAIYIYIYYLRSAFLFWEHRIMWFGWLMMMTTTTRQWLLCAARRATRKKE